MTGTIHKKTILNIFSAAALGVASLTVTAGATEKSVHIRGTVTHVGHNRFTVKTAQGKRVIEVSSKTKYAGVVKSSLNRVQPGAFIGTANVPDGKMSRALEVVVFPPAMKGAGLGNYGWDLKPGKAASAMHSDNLMAASSSMTNGTVTKAGEHEDNLMATGSSMTNGTVQQAHGPQGKTITVNYGNGRKTIVVPPDVPVVMLQKGSWKNIAAGAHVFVAAPAGNGPFKADRVLVGLDGTVPPM